MMASNFVDAGQRAALRLECLKLAVGLLSSPRREPVNNAEKAGKEALDVAEAFATFTMKDAANG